MPKYSSKRTNPSVMLGAPTCYAKLYIQNMKGNTLTYMHIASIWEYNMDLDQLI